MPIDAWKLRTGAAWLIAGALLAMMQLTGDWTRREVRAARRMAVPANRVTGFIAMDVEWVESN
jgi:hypothetical protein